MASMDPTVVPHTLTGLSAWQDLLRLLKDDAVSDLRGKPTLRHRNGRGYWYDRFRQGDRIIDRYIGEDSADLRERLERHEALRVAGAGQSRERARLVRLLRSEGYLAPDLATGQILTAMSRAGVFRLEEPSWARRLFAISKDLSVSGSRRSGCPNQ